MTDDRPAPTATVTPVILCGGSGTRLWPASRQDRPKPFIPLLGETSLFQQTARRLTDPARFGRPLVVGSVTHGALIREQLEAVGVAADLLLEPDGRDSGPAICAAAAWLAARDPAAVMLIAASDHSIDDRDAFLDAVDHAVAAARAGWVATFGIRPSRPATDYGYIQAGAAAEGGRWRAVQRFVEKPDATTAERYVAEGYLWNSGNFACRAETMLAEYARLDPQTVEAVQGAVAGADARDGGQVLAAADYGRTVRNSIDFAVMEHTDKAVVVDGAFGWSDVGQWSSIWQLAARDGDGNAAHGEVTFVDSAGSFAHAQDGMVIGCVGVTDIVVVATRDAVLITDRRNDGRVKELVRLLEAKDPTKT